MARKRFRRIGKRGSYFGFRKRHSSKRSSGAFSGMAWLLGAGIYGAGRAKMAQAISPITSKIPLGGYADNVGMIGLAWAAKRFIGGKVPLVKDIANSAMIVEAALIGQELISGTGISGATSNNSFR
jgi:hypothetical protein